MCRAVAHSFAPRSFAPSPLRHQQPCSALACWPAPQSLTLHLLCERAAGEESFWAPYLQTLPAPEQMQHPFFLVDQLRVWLQGSPLLQRLEQRLQQIQEVRAAP